MDRPRSWSCVVDQMVCRKGTSAPAATCVSADNGEDGSIQKHCKVQSYRQKTFSLKVW